MTSNLVVETGMAERVGYSSAPGTVVVIGGSSGKSVTLGLVRAMLRAAGCRVSLSLQAARERADHMTSRDRILLELPTLPTDAPPSAPDIIALTGLVSDELPPGLSTVQAAARLRQMVAATRRAVVLNGDDAVCLSLAAAARAPVWRTSVQGNPGEVVLRDGQVVTRLGGAWQVLCRVNETALRNHALVSDLVVATAVALAAGTRPDHIRAGALAFSPQLGHGEALTAAGGRTWLDDSAATRPGRTAATLMDLPGPVILIAGGRYGGQPLGRWARVVAGRVAHALLFGSGASALAAALCAVGATERIVRCADLGDAVNIARRLAERGDTVLYSPSGTAETASRFRDLVAPTGLRREVAA